MKKNTIYTAQRESFVSNRLNGAGVALLFIKYFLKKKAPKIITVTAMTTVLAINVLDTAFGCPCVHLGRAHSGNEG